jgi:hypothetical protein
MQLPTEPDFQVGVVMLLWQAMFEHEPSLPLTT